MSRITNINIENMTMLPAPAQVCSELPMGLDSIERVAESREIVQAILSGADKRHMAIVGPCSIHDPVAALEYAEKLKALADEVSDRIYIVMRAYFEKPRSTVGWKGLIYDPDINGSYNIERGIFTARKLLLRIVELGLPVATEVLDPILVQYIADTVSWAAIGARTTESQTHRQMASGLSMPVGFKNATDGGLQVALDAMGSARSRHSFIGVLEDGHVGVFRTGGNPYVHVVLRGGSPGPNYGAEHIAFTKVAMQKAGLRPVVVVDCSHANSKKQCTLQHKAFADVINQVASGETAIVGSMLESYLQAGAQKIPQVGTPAPDISITDECISWDETESIIRAAYEKLGVLFN